MLIAVFEMANRVTAKVLIKPPIQMFPVFLYKYLATIADKGRARSRPQTKMAAIAELPPREQ